MFVGRTGTMTFAAALALRDRRRIVRFPEERPIIDEAEVQRRVGAEERGTRPQRNRSLIRQTTPLTRRERG